MNPTSSVRPGGGKKSRSTLRIGYAKKRAGPRTRFIKSIAMPRTGIEIPGYGNSSTLTTAQLSKPELHKVISKSPEVACSTLSRCFDNEGIVGGQRDLVMNEILRLAVRQGPLRGSYVYRLDAILVRLVRPWGQLDFAMTVFHEMLRAGFRYHNENDYACLGSTLGKFVQTLPLRDVPSWERGLCSILFDVEEGPRSLLQILSDCTNVLSRCGEVRGTEIGGASLSTMRRNHPELPVLAAQLWLGIDRIHDIRQEYIVPRSHEVDTRHLGHLWLFLEILLHGGMSFRRLNESIDRINDPETLLNVFLCAELGDLSMNEVAALLSDKRVQHLFHEKKVLFSEDHEAWNAAGRPGTFFAFFRNRHGLVVQTQEPDQSPTPEVCELATQEAPEDPIVVAEIPEVSAPPLSPQKDKVDFDWVMAELQLDDVVDEFDEVQVRALLVHGFLRHGDRVASAQKIVPRERKRLWRQCKEFFDSKRDVNTLVDELIGVGILIHEGNGRLNLNRSTSASRGVRVIVESLRVLANTYAT